MKCYTHQDKDAIAYCQSCGNGLCVDCRIGIAGISYCQPCLDAGRIKPPPTHIQDLEDQLPTPTGPVTPMSRRYFVLGIVGLLMIAVSIHIIWLGPLLVFPPNPTFVDLFLPRALGFTIVATGISLTGLAIGEFKNYFNFRLGEYIGFFTIVSPWIITISQLLIFSGLVFIPNGGPYYFSYDIGPLAPIYHILFTIGSALIGILFILWPVALLSVRKQMRSSSAAKWASALFLIVAHILLISVPLLTMMFFRESFYIPFYYSILILSPGLAAFDFWHAVLIEPAVLLTAYMLNRVRISLKP
ncbi:MAG: hypothetical protein ACFE89_03820 [Candidatus Hodarchaeota archaeon]